MLKVLRVLGIVALHGRRGFFGSSEYISLDGGEVPRFRTLYL